MDDTETPDMWTVTWQFGPDAGARRVLGPGRHLVGRSATAELRCDDPTMDRHEGMLELADDGTASWRPFASGHAALIGDRGVDIAASTLVVQRGRPASAEHATVVDGSLVRRPRAVPRFDPLDVPAAPEAPAAPERPGSLVPALLGLTGAAVMAVVLHQVMFVVFGAVGALMAIGSWCTQWGAQRRRRRRLLDDHRRALHAREGLLAANRAARVAWHEQRVPTLSAALDAAGRQTSTLWSRRADHPDAFTVGLGAGAVGYADDVAQLTVDASLGEGARLAIVGDDSMGVARSIVAQLTASCGPADLRLLIVTDRIALWEVAAALPHLTLPDASAAIVDEGGIAEAVAQLGPREHAHLVVITDHTRALSTRTSPLRRILGSPSVALLAVLRPDDGVPHFCTAVLRCDGGTGRWCSDIRDTTAPTLVRLTGLGPSGMAAHARALARLRDPEDTLAADSRLPHSVALRDLVGPIATMTPEQIVQGWRRSAHMAPCTPLGVAADGIVDIDLVRDGPHGLLAGTTGAGKSELLRTLVAGLALHTSPERLAIVLVDYKGGATFDALVRLPHVVGVVTDLDAQLADRALRSLHAELRRREGVLREHGVSDVAALHRVDDAAPMPRLLVVIDEFAALVAEQPEFIHALVGIAQRGRSLGVHLLLATQRPHGVISDDIRANTDLRIALRLLDRDDALDVVGDATPATLPRNVPGRGVLRLGAEEHVTFQTAHLPVDDLSSLVDRVVAAAELAGAGTPAAPWMPPLPKRLRPLDLPRDAIGLCDDPDHQRHLPFGWVPDDGDVLVVGSAGTGRSTALGLLVDAALAAADTHVYVVHTGRASAAVPNHRRLAPTSVTDRERFVRLLHRLRAAPTDTSHIRTVVVIDDLDEVRRALDDPQRVEEHDALDEVLADPRLRIVVSATRPTAVSAAVVARCARRWLLHLHDPHDAAALGIAAHANPPAIPGRVHLVPEGLAAQLVVPTRRPARDTGCSAVPPIASLDPIPAQLALADLAPAHDDHHDLFLVVGADCTTAATAGLVVPEGEHVLVLGGARTGRSTALTRVTTAWREAQRDGIVAAVLPRRSSFDRRQVDHLVPTDELHRLTTLAEGANERTPLLVVIDDAELVDDPQSVLATLAAGRRADITLVAAARPDAIRQTYGHWTAVLRRSRLGLVATGGGDTDGDLLGVMLPRRTPMPPRAGLVWMVDGGRTSLVQVAIDTSSAIDHLRAAK